MCIGWIWKEGWVDVLLASDGKGEERSECLCAIHVQYMYMHIFHACHIVNSTAEKWIE